MKLQPRKLLLNAWNILKNSFALYKQHDTATLGAALSYYTVFSIAPMLLIVISITGILLGPEAAHGEVKRQMSGLVGPQSADFLQDIIKASYKPGDNFLFTIIAIVLLLIGATSVFTQLRTSLNVIWDIKQGAKKPIIEFFLSRLFSFAMIACIAFLLLVSLVANAIMQGFTDYLNTRLADTSVVLMKIFEIIFSFALTSFLFAFIYKFMSDAKLKWRSVLLGSVFTAVLFAVGKFLIGLYLGKSNMADTYGASGALVVILAWVFYSSQILFFGAEFTRALAIHQGVELDPNRVKSNQTVLNKLQQEENKKVA